MFGHVRALLMKIYGNHASAHLDLYQLSNQHRRKHGPDCDLYPGDPLQAPLWLGISESLSSDPSVYIEKTILVNQ